MAIKLVRQLNNGEKLQEDVHTRLGGLLFRKGTVIGSKDIEVLRAFMVDTVTVESVTERLAVTIETKPESATSSDGSQNAGSILPSHYDALFKLMQKVFSQMTSNPTYSMPLMEIRTLLQGVIEQLGDHSILTFRPLIHPLHDYFIHHSILTAITSYRLASWYGMEAKDLFPVALAGLFHDIGNTKVDADILLKAAPLNTAQREEMKRHTVIGYNFLRNIPGLNEGVKMAALQHHEKEDGSGYPLGVSGGQIHLYAKIVTIADIYHAMTSIRSYRPPTSPYVVLEQLFNDSFGKLNPTLVRLFIDRITSFSSGTLVRLNNQRVGEIIFIDRNHPTRPWVKIDNTIVNLIQERHLHIEDLIKD